ncbi:conserved Plasmodium protein, unknown function [Plasmodium chabaudi chabaudi]|uniref:Uncharacterized protein n=1 Tax=Plasmodium chabaudi chabaudi TaxID=31271 RepID=A0A4V0K216_PLACU|nr:conserved Plasmodium protein, unknown function [Plasmodium chabaudi chabaudi]VTZ66867.1 conserved Plasmodium protein, unknown function [Plasmodium chabaudi chabaudi]|eukprot:XP_016653093.1 conserved Plasmodium protein, unknown function [Plasmodium chabaudi chabaudi]
MYVNKVLEININDIVHDINVFYKNNKINNASGPLEVINTKYPFSKKSISQYDGTFVIHLEKVILICIQQLEKWNFFKYENPLIGTNKIDKCVCVPNLNLIILQKGNQIFVEEFQTVFTNNKINELKLLTRNSISVSSIFFFVFEDRLYILDKNGQLWQMNVKDCLSPSPQMEIVKTFELPKNINEIYFKIENKQAFVISYINEKEKCIYIVIYNIKTNISQKNKLPIPNDIKFEKGTKHITSVSLNNNYFIITFSSNELFIYKRDENEKNNMNNIHNEITKSQNKDSCSTSHFHKFLGEKQCSQLKYFNNKSLQEIEKYTLEYINKISEISSVSINDDNILFLIYSAKFLEKNTQNKLNNNKYASMFQTFTDGMHKYYQKLESYSFSKMFGSDNMSSSNLLYDISHNLYKRNNMHVTLVNIDNNPEPNLNTSLHKNYVSTKIDPLWNDLASDDTHFNFVTHLYNETIKKLTNHFNNIYEQKELKDDEKIKELLKYSKHLNIHEINQNKIKAFNKEFDDNKIEKEFLYMGFLKDLTSNKKYLSPLESYNNIYLCKIDEYYLILQNSEQNFNLILYKFKFLNKQELLLHLFFHSYYDAVLKSELYLFTVLHQFFVYSIYDYSGRYLDSSLLDYQCLFKIRDLFAFLGRAVTYDPFLVRASSEEVIKLLSLKEDAYNAGPPILTNMNYGEENNNYNNFFYSLSKDEQIYYPSKYINKYHLVNKINITKSDIHIDIDIQLNKLKNVLFTALRLIYYILKENENYDEISDCSDQNEMDEHLFINTITQANLKKRHQTWLDIEESDQSSESSQGSNSDRSFSLSDNENEEDKDNEDEKREYLHDLDYKAFDPTIEIINTNEDMKNVLIKYKIELLQQVYKYKAFKYLIKLLERERQNKSSYYINKQRMKNGQPGNSANATTNNNNKSNITDLFYIFKTNEEKNDKNELNTQSVPEESASNYSYSFSEYDQNCENNNFSDVSDCDKKSTNIYLINWTKFKYDYTPFDIIKYFLINKNYILTKIFYKYFKCYIDNNWQQIFYYIPLNTKIEDFFFLLPRVKKVNILSSKSNSLENVLPKIGSTQEQLNKDTKLNSNKNQTHSNTSNNDEALKLHSRKHSSNFESSSLLFDQKKYNINGNKKNIYEIHCSEDDFFEFFIIRCIKIITETHLIRSRLLMFVYVSMKIANQNNIYKIFNYDKNKKKYTYNCNYFNRFVKKLNTKQNEKNISVSLDDGKEGNEDKDIARSNSMDNISNNSPNMQNDDNADSGENYEKYENENAGIEKEESWNDSNLCDPHFIKNKLQIYLKKNNIKNKNVILIYSLFILIKMYLQSKENHKNIKFEEFLLMDVYKKLCLTIDFDKKYISYEYDQENGNISLFYNKIIDALSNYKYINAYIMTSKESYYSIFEDNIVELYFKNPTNILESIYFNILYTSEQLYVIFCLTTLKQLQFKHFTRPITHVDNKNRILPQAPLKTVENVSRYGLNCSKQKDRKNAKVDEIYIFLKYIHYAYKHKIILNDNYQFCYLFLIIFYKYIKINLIHFISIFNDFYNLFPKNVTTKPQTCQGNQAYSLDMHHKNDEPDFCDFKQDFSNSPHFDINSIFKKTKDNDNNVVMHNEHIEYIINCYSDQVEKYEEDEEDKMDSSYAPNCELVEKYLDIFEKHLNALDIIKFLNKEINHEENKLNININIIISSKNNMKKNVLNIFKIFKYIILYTNYKDDNFTQNCLQVYYNLFNSVQVHIFFFILFYIILFYSNDFRYLHLFIKYYDEQYPDLKNIHDYSNVINYLILTKAKTITIYDNFYGFYNFLKNVTSQNGMFSHVASIKETVLCLKTMLYIQKVLNKADTNKENGVNYPGYINKTKSNEDIYRSFSKLIVQTQETPDIIKNFNSLSNIDSAQADYKHLNINYSAKHIIYDNYIAIYTEKNKFKIFKNIIEYNIDICYNYKKAIKLIKRLQIDKPEQLLDSIVFAVSVLVSQNDDQAGLKTDPIKNESLVTFYLILFIIFSQNKKLNKYKIFIQNVMTYYTMVLPHNPQYVYNLSFFFSSYLCSDYSFFVNNIYKCIWKKTELTSFINHTNVAINNLTTTTHNFTTTYDLLQDIPSFHSKTSSTPTSSTSNCSEKIKNSQLNFIEKDEEIDISFFESIFLDNLINEGAYKYDDISSDFEKSENKKTQSVSSLFMRNEIDPIKNTNLNPKYVNNSDVEKDEQDTTSTDDTSQESEDDQIEFKQDSDNENSLNHLKINHYKRSLSMHSGKKLKENNNQADYLNKSETYKNLFLNNVFINHLKIIHAKINKSTISKWKTNHIIRSVNNIKKVLKNSKMINTQVESTNEENDEGLIDDVHFYVDKEQEQNYKINPKYYFYKCLFHNNLDSAFLYLLHVKDHIFIYNFFKHILQNNQILIVKKISIIDAFIRSVYRVGEKNERDSFLKKLLISISIVRYLLYHLHINNINKMDLKKLYFEDSFKKNIVKSLYKNKSEDILEVIVKIVDISKINLEHTKYELFIQNEYIICKIYNELLSSSNKQSNFHSQTDKTKQLDKDINNAHLHKNSNALTNNYQTKFQYIFEIEVEKEIMQEIQKHISNNFLLIYILKNFQRLSFNIDFIFKILFYIYQICLYYICPAIYFIMLSSFQITFDKSLSYLHQHIATLPKNKLISTMVSIRKVFFYFKDNLNHNYAINSNSSQTDADQCLQINNEKNIFSTVYPEIASKIEPITQNQFNNNMILLYLSNFLSNSYSEINNTDFNSPSQTFTFSLNQANLTSYGKNNFNVSKFENIENKINQDHFDYLLNKPNASPYLYDLNYLLNYLRINFYPYIFLSLPDYEQVKEVIDLVPRNYVGYYIGQQIIEQNEISLNNKLFNPYTMLTTNDIYTYLYSKRRYLKIFLDFYIYYNIAIKFDKINNEKCKQLFKHVLFQDYEQVQKRLKLRYTKWIFFKKNKLNKFYTFYNFLHIYSIYNQKAFYKLVIDNIFEIDILFLILFSIKNCCKIVKYILFKIVIITYFNNPKIDELSLQNLIQFISSITQDQQHVTNFDEFETLFTPVQIAKHVEPETETEAENERYEQFNNDMYIDQTMCNTSDTDNDKCDNVKSSNVNDLSGTECDENDRYSSENTITNILTEKEQTLIVEMSKIADENCLYTTNTNNEVKLEFDEDKINDFVEQNEYNQVENIQMNTNGITSLCLKYINIKYIIKKWIRNELKSILFMSLHQETSIQNLFEKSKIFYSTLCAMNRQHVFYYLKEMIRLILQTSRTTSNKRISQGRVHQFYHFFIILQAVNYLKTHVEVENSKHNEKTSYIFKVGENYTNQTANEMNNLDNDVDDKAEILKGLFFMLLIKVVNIYLPTINKLLFNNEENYLYYDKKQKKIILKYDIKSFIFILFNFIQTTYSKGYEFIYISLLFLMEYCINLVTPNEEVEKNPIFSYNFIYKKTQNIIKKYTENVQQTSISTTFDCVLNFVNSETYSKVKDELSKIYLKILSNCKKYMVLICKIIIGNRINIQDEYILLKNADIDILHFFTCNYNHIKINKQHILSSQDKKKQKINIFQKSENQNTDQVDIFNKNIYNFIKILLVIINYNIISFKGWQYYGTIKQIIADKDWYKIFESLQSNKKYTPISFLCIKNNKPSISQAHLEEYNTSSSSESTSSSFDQTLEFFSIKKKVISIHPSNDNDVKQSNLTNYNLKYYDSDSNLLSNEYNKEALSVPSPNPQPNTNTVEPEPVNKSYEEFSNNPYDEHEESYESLTKDAVLNKYGKGFLSSYLETLNTNKKCYKHFKNIYKKSKMINLLKYSLHILDYWDIDIADNYQEGDKKNKKKNKLNNHIKQSKLFRKDTELKAEGKEESLQLLIFFANYFYFFQHYIQYKILVKMYTNNNLAEANELFFNKGRMWSWYSSENKIKTTVEEYLIKNISCTDLYISKTNDEFLNLINKMNSKYGYTSKRPSQPSEKETNLKDPNNYIKNLPEQNYDCFYLKNYHTNKFNKHFIRSSQIQYYLFAKFNGKNISAPQSKKNSASSHDNAVPNISNNTVGNSRTKCSNFPMFLLNILDVYKNTTDVYDFYYQLIIHKLKDDDKMNLTKIQNYWNNLQIYFKNKINNYDLYLMLFYYQYFTFQSIQNANPSISYLPESEQKFILYLWINSTHDLEKKYR